ncbi:hypothetical protein [uncultured Eudoraea sp.]|uniref:hypothetical protein n=1 Tax=uncultured Eudoraea sp. TaxID=1035614 RepID=UPI002622331D|nr:hypothetical protein [uncultured Eudoraea sp.]
MKKQTKYLMLLTLLFVALSCSKDQPIELVEQTILQDDVPKFKAINNYDFSKLYKPRSNDLTNKKERNFWTNVWSNFFTQGDIIGVISIRGTDMAMVWEYPLEGQQDRIKIKGNYGHYNWNTKQPKVFIFDIITGLVIYSNFCEENKTGFFKENLKGLVDEYDGDGDGQTDTWRINPFHPESNGIGHIKTTLTDGQFNVPFYPEKGDCEESTTEINFDAVANIKNGVLSWNVVLGEERYEFISN